MRKASLLILLVLTALNILIFIFRDHFNYRPHASYRQLYEYCDAPCAQKWSRFISDYPAEEYNLSTELADSVFGELNSGFEKNLQLGAHLYRSFHAQMGNPSGELLSASPLQQYQMLKRSETEKLWCGNFALMYAWFAWTQDLASRTVEIMNPGDRHVLNEVFIPETGRWIMVDLTHNILAVRNLNGAYLDLPSVMDSVKKGSILRIYRVSGDTITTELMGREHMAWPNYYSLGKPLYYYHRINNDAVYQTSQKIRRYVFPESWYDVLNEDESNLLFRTRQVLLALWVVSFFVFLITRAKFRT